MTEGPRDKCCNMQRANAHYSCYIQVSVCDCVISPGDTNGLFQLGPHEVFFFFFTHVCLLFCWLVGWFALSDSRITQKKLFCEFPPDFDGGFVSTQKRTKLKFGVDSDEGEDPGFFSPSHHRCNI